METERNQKEKTNETKTERKPVQLAATPQQGSPLAMKQFRDKAGQFNLSRVESLCMLVQAISRAFSSILS